MASKYKFNPEGATWWKGGYCVRNGVRREHRYITDGNGRKFESCPYTDGWYVLADPRTSDDKPYRRNVLPNDSALLTAFCLENEEQK